MISNFVFLVHGAEADPLIAAVTKARPDIPAYRVSTKIDLGTHLQTNSRLIAFGSPVIVPADLLDRLAIPALNIHPGPPEFPGIYPSAFALYRRSPFFGTTLHIMDAKIDHGPIIAAPRFTIPEGCTRADLDYLSYQHVLQNLTDFLPHLISDTPARPDQNEQWGAPYNSLSDFQALTQIDPSISDEAFNHRLRAVGLGPDHGLEFTFKNHRFRMIAPKSQSITRAGLPQNEK